jgi:hypothetical protein
VKGERYFMPKDNKGCAGNFGDDLTTKAAKDWRCSETQSTLRLKYVDLAL